jgi:polyisoprenoid-binding protein YceI
VRHHGSVKAPSLPAPDFRAAALLLLVTAVAACASAANAAPLAYTLDPANTHVHWETRHFGTSTSRGRFDAIEGSITLDREAHRGAVAISIATASVSSGMAFFDGILRGPQLLATQEFPSAYFVASRFDFDADKLVSVTGEFTLRGASRALTLRALRFGCRADADSAREVCGGDFEGELQRSDFGITHSLPFVADRVRLVIQVEAFR